MNLDHIDRPEMKSYDPKKMTVEQDGEFRKNLAKLQRESIEAASGMRTKSQILLFPMSTKSPLARTQYLNEKGEFLFSTIGKAKIPAGFVKSEYVLNKLAQSKTEIVQLGRKKIAVNIIPID
jgi:hypothetical protein